MSIVLEEFGHMICSLSLINRSKITMQLVSLYSFDPTGRATANRIENQSITVTPPSSITDYSYVVPRAAPFYAESLVVKDGTSIGARTLVENVDYWCVIDFLSASIALNKRVSVGIALLDPGYSGTLYVTYQAVGGNYTLADYSILEELIRERYIVKHVSYEQVINLPSGFSPEWHQHEVADMVGMSSVVTSLDGIKAATSARNGSYGQIEQMLTNHVSSVAAHLPADVGLGNLKNYGVATLTDAKGGSSSKYVTADILKQYVTFDKSDTTVYLTKEAAAASYQTMVGMSNYYDKATSDARFAAKADTYTKTQVDGLVTGIDVSGGLDGYYTKIQSDGRYVAKTTLDTYSTTLVSDGKYATKTSLGSYYTKVDADTIFASKTQYYNKLQSDERYPVKTDLNQFLNLTQLQAEFLPLNALNNYYTKVQINANKITALSSTPQTNGDYKLTIEETLPNGAVASSSVNLVLTNHVKKTEVYTKTELDDKLVAASVKCERGRFNTRSNWPSYPNFELDWEVTRIGNVFNVHVKNVLSFYYREATYVLSTLPLASQATISGLKIRPMSTFVDLATQDTRMNAFGRLARPDIYYDTVTGDITWWVNLNHDTNDNNTYVDAGCFSAGMTFVADSSLTLDLFNKLMLKGTSFKF